MLLKRTSFDRAEYYVNPSFEYSVCFALNGELVVLTTVIVERCRYRFRRIYNSTDYDIRVEIRKS